MTMPLKQEKLERSKTINRSITIRSMIYDEFEDDEKCADSDYNEKALRLNQREHATERIKKYNDNTVVKLHCMHKYI